MANSPRMRWPYPSAGVDPWYDAFENFVTAQDASTYALDEAKNIILSGGGVISWSAISGVLSWGAALTLNSAGSGVLESIPAGNVTVPNDGDFGFVTFVSASQENVTLTMQVASFLPDHDPDNALVIFKRKDGRIYFRNGAVLQDGESVAIIEDGPGAGSNLITFQREGANFGVTDTLNFVGPLAVSGSSGGGVSELELQLATNSVEVTTTPYIVDPAYRAFYVNVAFPATVVLPQASTLNNQFLLVKSVTSNAVTVQANGTDTIDGASSLTIDSPYASVLLQSVTLDGLLWSWYVASKTTLAGTGTVTDVTASSPLASSGGTTPNISLTGTISPAFGGTGLSVYAVGDILSADTTSSLARVADVSLGNVLLSGGAGAMPSYGKVGLTTHVSGVLPVANGGTSFSSYTTGDLLYANSATTLAKLHDVATGNVLLSGGVGVAPSYGKVGLTTHVTGTLPVGSGGTGTTLVPSAGQLLIGTGTGYTAAYLTAGTGISITTGTGSVTVNNAGVTSVAASGGVTGMMFAGSPVTTTGTLTLGGTLNVTHGGTGNNTAPAQGQLLIGDGATFQLATLIPGAGIGVENGPGTISILNLGVMEVDASGGTTGFYFTGGPINRTGVLTLNGTLDPSHGGTGVTGTASNGQLLIGNGSGFTLSTLSPGTGIVITNGPGTVTISATGSGIVNSVTASAPLSSSGGSNPNISLTGIVSPARGGTGTGTLPANGQLLIGNGTTYTAATLTGGTGISVSNGAGSVTLTNTGITNIGTVTPIVTSGGSTPTITHALSGVSFGTYTNATVTVNAFGHVTAIASGTGGVSTVTATTPVISSGGSTPNISLGNVPVPNGGTGITSYVVGDLLYATGTLTLGKLADVATGNVLLSGGVSTPPSYGKVGMATHVTGVLPPANGGTGSSTVPTNGQIPIGNGTTYTPATITAGLGITVTNGPGSITLSASGSVISFSLTAAEPIAAGKFVACNGAGNAVLADVTVPGRFPALGICTNVVGSSITVQPVGPITILSGLTPGTTYYVSTFGTLDTAPPIGALMAQTALQAFSATAGLVLTSNQPVYL